MSKIIESLEAKALKKRSWSVRLADELTSAFGSFFFLTVNSLVFIFWILINTSQIPGIFPFDPFPFPLLTTAVSLEAIILTLIVLMSQNRQSFITSLREEIDMQVNLAAEREVTKVLEILQKIAAKNGINFDDDPELSEMLKKIEVGYIEKTLQKQLEEKGEPLVKTIINKTGVVAEKLVKSK